MNLSGCSTKTTVEFNNRYKKDRVFIDDKEVTASKKDRVVNIINIIRKRARITLKSRVVSKNNFPSDAGIASSASAFSALALAGSTAAGLKLSRKDLSILARLGSGSACRSVVDGFSEWRRGRDNQSSYATQLAPLDHWNLRDVVVIVDKGKKKASSTEGHSVALTSPHYKKRQIELKRRVKGIRKTLLSRNFKKFGELLEEEAVCLHVMAMTSKPPIFYWNKGTMELIHKLLKWRQEGLLAYFTMDAGPNVHVICQAKNVARINRKLKTLSEVVFTIVNKPTEGTRLTTKHLF